VARIRCFHPSKAIHFSLHREPFVAGIKQCYLCWKHIFTFPFLAFHAHTEISYIFMFVLLFMDSICSDFLPRFRLYPVAKLHTFFFALNILLRALKIHFFCWHRSMIPARDRRNSPMKITHSDQLPNHRLHHLQPEKRYVEKGEKREKSSEREIKLFLNKNGKFTSFLTSGLSRYSCHVKLISCLQLPLCFCLRFSLFRGMKVSQVMEDFMP
jgi:hypothetical protein